MLPIPHDVDGMAGGVDGLDRIPAFDLDAHADLFERQRGELLRVQRVAVVHQSGFGRQDLGVLQFDAAFSPGIDREDRRLHRAAVHILQQGRIAEGADDVLIRLTCLFTRQDLAFDRLAVDPQRELGDGRTGGQGKDVRALDGEVVVVAEHLVDVRRGYLILDGAR